MQNKKKGSIFDTIFLIFVPLLLLFILVPVGIMYSGISSRISAISSENPDIPGLATGNEMIQKQNSQYTPFNDFAFGFLVFGLWIVVLIISYSLGNENWFLIIYVILMIPLLILGIVMDYAYANLLESSLSAYLADWNILSYFLNHSMIFSIVFIVSVGFAIFSKRGGV